VLQEEVAEEKVEKEMDRVINHQLKNMMIEFNALIVVENSQKFHPKDTFLIVKINKRNKL
jgi:hypothetical protein